MKPSVLYRTAAGILVLFAVAHTLAFTQSDPGWSADAMLASMRSIHFDVQGFNRSYWDFFVAAGYSVGVFYMFSAFLAWQLSRLPAEALVLLRSARWAFAVCFAAISILSVMHLFIIPIAFSVVTTVVLGLAAASAPK